jgi:Uma2 family endonuclease
MQLAEALKNKYTIAEFFELEIDDSDNYFELHRGQLLEKQPNNMITGRLAVTLGSNLYGYVEKENLGQVLAPVGYLVSAEEANYFIPDLSFIALAKLNEIDPHSHVTFPPDLAVEFAKTIADKSKLADKAYDYIKAGTQLVWIVSPTDQTVSVYRQDQAVQELSGDAELEGDPAIPDCRLAVTKVFE